MELEYGRLVVLDAELVRPSRVSAGRLFIGRTTLQFLAERGAATDVGESQRGGGGGGAAEAGGGTVETVRWQLGSIKQMHRRRYLMAHTAIELFRDDGSTLLLNFTDKRERSRLRKLVKTRCPLAYRDRDRHTSAFRKMLSDLQEKWHRREITNFEYLMFLNELAGRTHNDLNQYPVFPWVLSDYHSETLNLADPAVYRDLSRPMGAQVASQREVVRRTFEEFCDPDIPRFHYGSHFSTAGFVLYYLLRVEPFTAHHKVLQGGRFDHADRLFHSLASTFEGCTHSSSDVKELIPELFYLPDMLLNRNGLSLGARQDGQPVGDVVPLVGRLGDRLHREAPRGARVGVRVGALPRVGRPHLRVQAEGKGGESALNVFFI